MFYILFEGTDTTSRPAVPEPTVQVGRPQTSEAVRVRLMNSRQPCNRLRRALQLTPDRRQLNREAAGWPRTALSVSAGPAASKYSRRQNLSGDGPGSSGCANDGAPRARYRVRRRQSPARRSCEGRTQQDSAGTRGTRIPSPTRNPRSAARPTDHRARHRHDDE